jgi:hypothetical protein
VFSTWGVRSIVSSICMMGDAFLCDASSSDDPSSMEIRLRVPIRNGRKVRRKRRARSKRRFRFDARPSSVDCSASSLSVSDRPRRSEMDVGSVTGLESIERDLRDEQWQEAPKRRTPTRRTANPKETPERAHRTTRETKTVAMENLFMMCAYLILPRP